MLFLVKQHLSPHCHNNLFLKLAPYWPLRRKKPLIKVLLGIFLLFLIYKRRINSLILINVFLITPFVESKNPQFAMTSRFDSELRHQ